MVTQERIFLSPPDVRGRERQLLLEALDSNWIAPAGPDLEAFEHELAAACGVPHAVALSSGTAALHLALKELGVGSGDEVLVSTFTFVASANAVRYCGAEPVLIDSDHTTWNMDPDLLQQELVRARQRGRVPKAAVVVDLYGQCADYRRILTLCEEHGMPVVEDAAEALGATCYERSAGSFGVAGVVSFNGNKVITCSGGGALLCHEERLAERVRHLATQARQPALHYEHEEVGYNYRLSNLLAAVGRAQLETLEERVQRRRSLFDRYVEALGELPGVAFMPEAPYGRSTRWLTTLTIDRAQAGLAPGDVLRALSEQNIEARPTWKPMHLQPLYRNVRVVGGDVSQRLFETGLCLPSGSSLTDSQQERVIETVLQLPWGRRPNGW